MNELEQAARELILEFGGTGIYTSSSEGSYDVSTASVTRTELSQSTPMVLVDLTLQSNGYSTKFGTQVLAGDREAYVIPPHKSGGQVVSITPNSDRLTFNGVTYTVVTYKDANPSGSDSWVWYLYLRR
jgi:hypothetical protein